MQIEKRGYPDNPWVADKYMEDTEDLVDGELQYVMMDELCSNPDVRSYEINSFIFHYHNGYPVYFTGSLRSRVDELKTKWSEFYNDLTWNYRVAQSAMAVGLNQKWHKEDTRIFDA